MKSVKLCYPNGKTKAFTISYDDGVLDDIKLLSFMEECNIKGTFHLNSKTLGRTKRAVIDGYDTDVSTIQVKDVACYYQKQEVACHTLDHFDLTKLQPDEIEYQVKKDKENLEQFIQKPVIGFSYPFGSYNQQVKMELKKIGIQYARTVNSTHSFCIPDDFLEWNPTCHHNDVNLNVLLEEFLNKQVEDGKLQLFYLWGHSYEFQQKKNWNVIEEIFCKVHKHESEIWFATNGDIFNYIAAYKELLYDEKQNQVQNKSNIDLWVCIDDKTYFIPKQSTQKMN